MLGDMPTVPDPRHAYVWVVVDTVRPGPSASEAPSGFVYRLVGLSHDGRKWEPRHVTSWFTREMRQIERARPVTYSYALNGLIGCSFADARDAYADMFRNHPTVVYVGYVR